MERPVHGIERTRMRRPLLDDRVRHIAERTADGVDPREIALRGRRIGLGLMAQPIGTFAVDDAALDEPRQGVAKGR